MPIPMLLKFAASTILLALPFASWPEEDVAFDYAPHFNKHQATLAKVGFCEPENYDSFLLDAEQKAISHCGDFIVAMRGLPGKYQAEANGDLYNVHAIELELQVAGKQYRTRFAPDQIPSFLNGVFYADFNGDGKPDFAVKLHDHGVGFGASFGDLLLLLSDEQGYRYVLLHRPVTEMKLHFVRLQGDKAMTFLLPRYAQADSRKTRDHRDHSFFVYDLLEFCTSCDNEVRIANDRDPRFPFWVQHTWRESHGPTSLLTRKQQKELAGDALKGAEFGRLN